MPSRGREDESLTLAMVTCDVLIVGGGPAGSTCAWKLRQAGLSVVVMDRAMFPRDKVCAGWITPQVVADLQLDLDHYREGRTLQVIDGFRIGLIGRAGAVDTGYAKPISFAIRRCEFDHYLLERSGSQLMLGAPVTDIRRDAGAWVVNEAVRAPMLIGAGGHFCPVARRLNPTDPTAGTGLVVAQEAEFAAPGAGARSGGAEWPELFFCSDLKGYGWCVRKEQYLNIGLGRADSKSLPAAAGEFRAFLAARGQFAVDTPIRWRGHAYLLQSARRRRLIDDGVMLVGDAAGLAYSQSGEGIRPAVESGLLAAATVLAAEARYTRSSLEPYTAHVAGRQKAGGRARLLSYIASSPLGLACGRSLLRLPSFVRHVVLNQWFLRASEPPLVIPSTAGALGPYAT